MNDNKTQGMFASPYRGIHPFRYVDHPYFFGREETVDELFAKVLIYRLMLLFGESGAGKSSVINAGLIPALEKEGMSAERIRLRPFADEPILIERIPAGENKDGPFLPTIFCDEGSEQKKDITCSLDEFLKRIYRKAKNTYPVLVFDQFEELFTLFSQKNKEATEGQVLQNRILNTIFEIVNNQTLKVKVLITIREDFLGRLEVLSKKYPQILDNYLRLKHLDESGAKKAILDPFKKENSFRSCLTSELAETIVQGLSYHDGTTNRVHPTQLQIVCSSLWERYAKTMDKVSFQAFEKMGKVSGILEGFLKSELERVGQALRPKAIMILGNLITESGTRDIVSEGKIRGLISPKKQRGEGVVSKTLNILEDQRVINRTAQRGTYYYEVASEYLIEPIQKEKQKLDLQQDRKRRRIRVLYGFVIILFLFSIVSYKAYSLWLEDRPWGYVRSLSTGTAYALKGESVSFGRSTEGLDYKNTIDLRPRVVSRIHLLVSRRNLSTVDMRSLNGTTVNGEFLPYGDTAKLENGDIIVLANIAGFQFNTIEYSPFQFWNPSIRDSPPPSGWGILIDEKFKVVHYLEAEKYFLSLGDQNQIILQKDETENTILTLRGYNQGGWTFDDGSRQKETVKLFTIEDRKDDIDLFATMKMGDYTYRECTVPPGEELYEFQWLYLQCDRIIGRDDYQEEERKNHAIFQAIYRSSSGGSFRIIPILTNLESEKLQNKQSQASNH